MAIQKDDLIRLIDKLQKNDQKSVCDFIQFLVKRSEKSVFWEGIDSTDPDDEPLTEEELQQLSSKEGYLKGEEARHEFGLQVDLP
jgi:hypothetical protein